MESSTAVEDVLLLLLARKTEMLFGVIEQSAGCVLFVVLPVVLTVASMLFFLLKDQLLTFLLTS